eukprot:scpid53330/ scgid17813/ B(0,+)-type amino acid transporter 1; Glycoprotein-associated amino acid transporter b0,+AT1; Solute carrier family 7 member 9
MDYRGDTISTGGDEMATGTRCHETSFRDDVVSPSSSDPVLESSYSRFEVKPNSPGPQMKKQLGLVAAISLIAGTIIGSGIFLTPNDIVGRVGSGAMALIVWTFCGFITLCGSLSYAELGTALTESGGEYTYLRYAFGRLPAFLYCWSSTVVVRPVSGGIILLTFARYVSDPFYDGDCTAPSFSMKGIALAALLLITVVGCLDSKWSAHISSIMLVIKFCALGLLILLGIVSLSRGHYGQLETGFQNTTVKVGSIAFAFYDALWAYDGWNNANYVSGELKDPKILIYALVLAVPLVTVCYVLVNVAYMSILTTQVFLKSEAIAVDAVHKVLGNAGLVIMPLLVAASCFGAANSTLFAGSRVSAASAKHGDLPRILGLIHSSLGTPLPAFIFQALMVAFYIVAVDIGSLILFYSFIAWLFYGSSMVILMLLRRREPDLPRLFKVPLPLPIIMLLFSIFLVVAPFYQHPTKSSISLGFMILSIPLYFIFASRRWLRQLSGYFTRASDWTVRMTQHVFAVS